MAEPPVELDVPASPAPSRQPGLLRRALDCLLGRPASVPLPRVTKPNGLPESSRGRVDPVEETVHAALSTVDDPEVGIDLVNLGLLRGWTLDGERLHVRLTATSPACPVGPHLVDRAREALEGAFPDHTCSAELVWDPPWSPADMTDRARAWLGRGVKPAETRMDRTLDLRAIVPRDRHPLVFQTFAELDRGAAFVLVNDHDPKPLHAGLQAEHGPVFGWEYLERGPEVWKVRISRVS